MTLKSQACSSFIVGGSLLLSACATATVVGGDPGLTFLQMRELPTPNASDLVSGQLEISLDRLAQQLK